jgi:hypothetical protein
MVLAMSRPWKHPKTGIYWLRKGVPDDLREAVGKREEKFSLKTRDPLEESGFMRRHSLRSNSAGPIYGLPCASSIIPNSIAFR